MHSLTTFNPAKERQCFVMSLYNSCWKLRTPKLSLRSTANPWPQKLCLYLNKLVNHCSPTLVVILMPLLNSVQATLTTVWFSFLTAIAAVPAFKSWCLSSSHSKANEHSNPGSVSFGKTNWKAKSMHHLSCYVSCCFEKSWWLIYLNTGKPAGLAGTLPCYEMVTALFL